MINYKKEIEKILDEFELSNSHSNSFAKNFIVRLNELLLDKYFISEMKMSDCTISRYTHIYNIIYDNNQFYYKCHCFQKNNEKLTYFMNDYQCVKLINTFYEENISRDKFYDELFDSINNLNLKYLDNKCG